jgi:uncharacterized protein (TIGR02284 family)
MSTDKSVTEDLMKTLENGKEGFEKAAGLVEKDNPTTAATFRRLAQQRATFYGELQEMAKNYGDKVEESGSIAAALHRGWMSLKDAVAGSDPKGALDAAEQGEDHAVKAYEKALEETDMSTELRTVVSRQFTSVKTAHDEVKALRDAHDMASKS